MSTSTPHHTNTAEIENTRWHIDPPRSTVEFHVPHSYRLHPVEGRFDRYDGMLYLTGK